MHEMKAQLSTMADEIAKLKETIQQHSNGAVSPASEEGSRSVEFLSNEYDNFNRFRTEAKMDLQRITLNSLS